MSGATVSRVFNKPGSVSPLTREKVLKAAKELDYYPNIIATNFIKGISGNIGVVIPRIKNIHMLSVYYFAELLGGIGDALAKRGYNLILLYHDIDTMHSNAKDNLLLETYTSCEIASATHGCAKNNGNSIMPVIPENGYTKYFKGNKVDGCILLGTFANDPSLVKLKEEGYRFCLINNYIENSGISYIDADNVKGSCEAVKYLISLGHDNIAFLNGPMYYTNSIDRLKGYKKALKEYNIPFNSKLLFEGNYGRKSGYYAAKRILSVKNPPSAVFVSNDRMAAGLLQGLLENGVKVPDEISIVGYDDSDVATVVTPQLTTVHVPFYEMGYRCADEFIKCIKGENTYFGIYMQTKIVIRKSGSRPKSVAITPGNTASLKGAML